MRKKIVHNLARPLITGSFIVAVGTTIGNLFNYLFHLSMGRFLIPSDYGTLTTLISFISLFGIAAMTITTVVAKFVSRYRATESWNDVAHILRVVLRKVIGGVIVLGIILFLALMPLLQDFLKISDKIALQVTATGILLSLLGAVNSGSLQGLHMFRVIAFFNGGVGILRFIFALSFVYLGFGLRGAVIGFVLSYLLGYILTFIPLIKYFGYKESPKEVHFGSVVKYSLPTLIGLGGLSMFISADIILVKHFFADFVVGLYAALSVIGRVIFFGTSSISLVMFPIISTKHTKGKNYNPTFLLSLLLVLIAAVSATLLYFLIPDLLIKLFYSNKSYLQEARNLGWMGVFFTLYSIASLFIYFFLSISKTKIVLLAIIASILQIVLIWNFHASLQQVIYSSITAITLLVIVLILYYIYDVYKSR